MRLKAPFRLPSPNIVSYRNDLSDIDIFTVNFLMLLLRIFIVSQREFEKKELTLSGAIDVDNSMWQFQMADK